MISTANLNFWIKNNYNVLFRGKHGVGKTATILQAFDSHNLKFQYFSASTMDPWVDFIGVPKEKIDENGNSYLDLIRPKHFQNDEVEAIFLDEFNRSSKKVRNAVMELIQFKSINGKKFNNLKIIWAAINPEDDEENKYDVEALDPAQMDRFHVVTDIPYQPHVPYFRDKYGPQIADVAVTWWKELTKEQKDLVSPRRLDYAMDMHTKGGDLKFILPNGVNTNKLVIELATGSISKKLDIFYNEKKSVEAKAFLNIENNYAACANYIVKNKNYHDFFLPLLSDEKLVGLMSKEKSIETYVFSNYTKYQNIIQNIASAKSSPIARRASKILKKFKIKPTLIQAGSSVIANSAVKAGVTLHYTSQSSVNFMIKYNCDILNIDLKYSGNRLSTYKWYEKNLPQVLTDEVATHAVQDLAYIANNSQKTYTIDRKMKKLSGLLNHACNYFITNNKPVPLNGNATSTLSTKLDDFII
jgi:hypothetical protein